MSSNISNSVPIGERVVIRMIEKEALTLVSEYPSTFQGFSILNLFPPENSEHLDNFVPCVHDMTISLTEAAALIDNVSDHKLHDSKVTINGVECKIYILFKVGFCFICLNIYFYLHNVNRHANYNKVKFYIFCKCQIYKKPSMGVLCKV